MKNIKSFQYFINENISKDASYYHKDEVMFLWDYDKKKLDIIPNSNTAEKYKSFKPITLQNIDRKQADEVISILIDHPYDNWNKLLDDAGYKNEYGESDFSGRNS